MDEKKKAMFEQLKIELRSILLSSKDGVSERLILADYEMLSCQRLPYKNLGYANVAALLADMPDVAKEIRLASGEVIYKAVSNASTAHIQRLVGNQRSAKKKSGRGKGGVRGRGGAFRGGVARGGRGGRGGSFRGSLTPRFAGSDRGRGGSFVPRGARARGGASFSSSNFASSKENVNPRGFNGPRGMSRSSDLSFAGDARGSFNTASTLNNNKNSSNFTGDVRNKGGNLPVTRHNGKPNKGVWEDVDQDSSDLGPMYSPVKQDSPENRQGTSPMINLKIGLGSDGNRTIVAGSPIKTHVKHANSSEIDAVTPGGQIDLRGYLQEKRRAKETATAGKVQPPSTPTAGPERKKVSAAQANQNQEGFKRNLPPRFMKQQKQHKLSHRHHNEEENSELAKNENLPLQEQKALHTILSNNWVPPENGAQYLEAYHKHFADHKETAPTIEIKLGKANKEKGFYGQLQHDGVWYFPLEIQKTEEQAKQNAARSFCITNKIPLPPHQSDGTDYVRFASSELTDQPCPQPAWMDSLTQQLKGSIDLGSPANQQQESGRSNLTMLSPSLSPPAQSTADPPRVDTGPPLGSKEVSQRPNAFPEDPLVLKKLENIYKMLKPAGMFVKSLADFYLKTYSESLDLDTLPHLQAMTGCFTLEETIPGRIIVCPVPGASFKIEFNNNSCSTNSNAAAPPAMASPSSSISLSSSSAHDSSRQDAPNVPGDSRLQQLETGSELEVIFSYAYSASEVYFQLALSEDIIYEIEEELNQMCSAPAPSDWTLPGVGELVAASYEDGWYRAQIYEINPPKVHVYFIDYGNRESIDVSELRPVPQKEVSQLTPPLALRCALTASQAGFFSKDTQARLEELAAAHPVLRAVVLDNSDACIVELQQKDGAPLDLSSFLDSQEEKITDESSQSVSTSDPDMLVLPDAEAFVVYICQIMTECSLLLRIVDSDYSDALDELEQVISDNFYSWPIPQDVKERHIYAAMVLATADEAEDEGLLDQNKYHRIRVLHQNKDGSFTCYLPDHGDEETLQRNQLREIDSQLNRSLPYQAVLATLHGLDHVEETLKPTAMEILLKLVNFTAPVYAVRHGNSQTLEIDIVDTETKDELNVNQSVIAALDEVREGLAQGKAVKDVMHTMFGSSTGSQADSSSLTSPSAVTEEETEDLQASLGRLSVTGEGNEAQSRLNRVQDYVDDLPPVTSPGTGTKLYTWSGSNEESLAASQPQRLPSLPKYWPYTFLKSVSLYITWVESPSHFVAIPLEQQGGLKKVETAMANHFSTTPTVAETLSEQGLYAVRSEGKYRRALYMGMIGGMAKIFFPDHYSYDTVELDEIMSLPEQFYSLPFLAYKMRLRAMKPNLTQDWPAETTTWFKENFSHKALYAVIFSQDGLPAGSKHTAGGVSNSVAPGTLAIRLIDTSGEDDIIVDELMGQLGMAVSDSSQEQV